MFDPLYVRARSVLLDVVEALAEHRDAIILVGAQAIYLQTGDADLAVAEYTTDADFIVSPNDLPTHHSSAPSSPLAASHLANSQAGG